MRIFLGCRLKRNPAQDTLKFVEAAQGYFNEAIPDIERRARYQVALLARLQDEQDEVNPQGFASVALESRDRVPFLEKLAAAGIRPSVPFARDLSLVKVAGFKMTFENGMVLIGSREDLGERVRAAGGDSDGVLVDDTVKSLSGR